MLAASVFGDDLHQLEVVQIISRYQASVHTITFVHKCVRNTCLYHRALADHVKKIDYVAVELNIRVHVHEQNISEYKAAAAVGVHRLCILSSCAIA